MAGRDKGCEWVSAQVIASKYTISRATVLRLARHGFIPSIRIGGQVRFDPMLVDEVLQRGGEKEAKKAKKE